jgi:hypothetical protein
MQKFAPLTGEFPGPAQVRPAHEARPLHQPLRFAQRHEPSVIYAEDMAYSEHFAPHGEAFRNDVIRRVSAVEMRFNIPPGARPGQVFLAGSPDPQPDRGEPVVRGSGERTPHDSRSSRPAGSSALARSAGQAALPAACRALAGRSWSPAPDSTTRGHARQCHCGHVTLIHAVVRDLHDRVACPHASTVRSRPVSRVPRKRGNSGTHRSPALSPPDPCPLPAGALPSPRRIPARAWRTAERPPTPVQ